MDAIDADNTTGKYILVDGEPVEEPDLMAWGRWFEDADRQVALTYIDEARTVRVSTVFLGLDHTLARPCRDGAAPILWETMVFGGKLDQEQERYETKAEAVAGHNEWVKKAQEAA